MLGFPQLALAEASAGTMQLALAEASAGPMDEVANPHQITMYSETTGKLRQQIDDRGPAGLANTGSPACP